MDIFYQNVNRIRSKISETNINILNCNYDIICLTETNFNESVFDRELVDSRYNVYRRDRQSTGSSKRDGGGVLVAIKKQINSIRLNSWETSFEDIWLKVQYDTSIFYLCVCYLPPHLSADDLSTFYDHVQCNINNKIHNQKVLIIFKILILLTYPGHNHQSLHMLIHHVHPMI